jgi:hypothetical protein
MEQPMTRPKVAVIATTFFPDSHADVIATRLIKGYEWEGEFIQSRLEVVSFYLEQIDPNDMGVALTDEFNIPRYPTVGEALACGGTGVQVDGVVIIGEHGDYEYNEFEQKLYPRRRLFDSAVASMVSAGKFVPIFNDKHLAQTTVDALSMYDTAKRLGIPLHAGSTIPLAWRIPTATEWPLGEPMTEIVVAGYGPTEIYGFHNLEGLQVHAERRAGGETGVVAVRGISGEAAKQAVADGRVNPDLLDKALATFSLDEDQRRQARESIKDVFLVKYADGLRAAVVNCDDVIANWGIAAVGPGHEMECQIWLQKYPHSHFIFMVRQIESMILNGVPNYPIERTLLTTLMLDALMRSRHDGASELATPELAISYQTPSDIPDTGVKQELPPEELPRKGI